MEIKVTSKQHILETELQRRDKKKLFGNFYHILLKITSDDLPWPLSHVEVSA